ncbi:MAG: hypothetical protein QG614_604 [Patescibacteria group bacterium]|nr:hypothetical protein [Patescibacteria group bacterium]
MLTPGTEQTLKELKKRGILCVILSTHPKNLQNTQKILEDKILHFRLKDYFFELHATEEFHGSKGDFIIKILQKYNIPKTKALMIGDNYLWDYKPARNVGIEAVLLQSEYMKKDKRLKVIKNIKEVLKAI